MRVWAMRLTRWPERLAERLTRRFSRMAAEYVPDDKDTGTEAVERDNVRQLSEGEVIKRLVAGWLFKPQQTAETAVE
jgi:hypothetical protein